MHCTGVAPTGNGDPDARLQLTCTGDTPPVVVGGGNVTDTAAPVNETVVTFAGHEMVSGGPDGMVVSSSSVERSSSLSWCVVVGVGVGELGDEHRPSAATQQQRTSQRAARERWRRELRLISDRTHGSECYSGP